MHPIYIRGNLSSFYINGQGLEIGALHNPLPVKEGVIVKNVDRMGVEDLRKHYPELNQLNLVNVDIIDNGETLYSLETASQDFIIANHFLEHCQDVIQTLFNLYRVLKPDGILFMAIPDKRFTFDLDREVTPFSHLEEEFFSDPEKNKYQHFKEWVEEVNKITGEKESKAEIERLLAIDYSIHFHAWTLKEMMDFVFKVKERYSLFFEPEVFFRNGEENILILRKENRELPDYKQNLLFSKASEFLAENELIKAEKTLSNLAILDPFNGEIVKNLSRVKMALEKYEETIDLIADILYNGHSLDSELFYNMAECLEKTGNPEVAEEYRKKGKALAEK